MCEATSTGKKKIVELPFSICLLPENVLTFQIRGFVVFSCKRISLLFFKGSCFLYACMSIVLGALTYLLTLLCF